MQEGRFGQSSPDVSWLRWTQWRRDQEGLTCAGYDDLG
jgi:hypothetical protein